MPAVKQRDSPDASESSRSVSDSVVFWLVTAALVLAGGTCTLLALVLPEAQVIARAVTTTLGVLLTAVGGIYASYALTRSSTAREIEASYNGYLTSAAISIAHVYSTLQHATASRRSGAYVHEETYQEAIIMSAEALLTQFDAVTRLSGSVGDGLVEKKQELDSMRAGLFERTSGTVEAMVSLDLRGRTPTPEPVNTRCPRCSTRVASLLALRAGWTSKTTCSHCRATFNVHRRSDMSVYAGRVHGEAPSSRSVSEAESGMTGDGTVEGQMPAARKEVHEGDPSKTVAEPRKQCFTCPSCGTVIAGSFQRASGRREFLRTCLRCFQFIELDAATLDVVGSQQVSLHAGAVVGREASYALTPCPEDDFQLRASFSVEKDERWFAVCVPHRRIVAIERSDYASWLHREDPEYYQQRSAYEQSGGKRIISPALIEDDQAYAE